MGEDREKVVIEGPDEAIVAEVEGHALAEELVAEREAIVEEEDVEGHKLTAE